MEVSDEEFDPLEEEKNIESHSRMDIANSERPEVSKSQGFGSNVKNSSPDPINFYRPPSIRPPSINDTKSNEYRTTKEEIYQSLPISNLEISHSSPSIKSTPNHQQFSIPKKIVEKKMLPSDGSLEKLILFLLPLIKYQEKNSILEFISNKNFSLYQKIMKQVSLFRCELCSIYNNEKELSCGHNLCVNCLYTHTQVLNSDSSLLIFGCPKCYSPLRNADLVNIFKGTYSRFVSEKLKSILSESKTKCIGCLALCGYSDFLEGSCMHICKNCIYDRLRLCKINCDICFEPYHDNLEGLYNLLVTCQNCNDEVFLIGDKCRELNDSHLLCGSCLQQSLENEKCILCNRQIFIKEQYSIIRSNTRVCKICNSKCFVGETNTCNKCKEIFCEFCFDQENCSLCEKI